MTVTGDDPARDDLVTEDVADGDAVTRPEPDVSPIDAAIIERLARWAERDAEIGRAAEIEALETRNRKLEADLQYMIGRAAMFEAQLAELRDLHDRDATSLPVALAPVLRRVRVRWWRREGPSS